MASGLDFFDIIELVFDLVEAVSSTSRRRSNYSKYTSLTKYNFFDDEDDSDIYDPHRVTPLIKKMNSKQEIKNTSINPSHVQQVKPSHVQEAKPVQVQEVKHSSIQISNNARQTKLEILLLTYMFNEDDGKINIIEKSAIKKHYNNTKHTLTRHDIDFIKDMRNMDNSLINIRAYISQNDVTETEISNAISTLKEISFDSKKYKDIIKRIESSIVDSIGY